MTEQLPVKSDSSLTNMTLSIDSDDDMDTAWIYEVLTSNPHHKLPNPPADTKPPLVHLLARQ